ATAKDVLRHAIPLIGGSRGCACPHLLSQAVITSPKAFPPAARRRLALLLDKYFPHRRTKVPKKGRRG
ncbi:MAG: hypothetical protein HY216_15695, partial [Candidatus Rokubacteria bacterium]|nr:hypothetical protein [Candidatus Rokubacteria bacterium]